MHSLFDLGIIQVSWRDILDISVVAFIFYHLILLIKGTRAVSVVYGLLLVLVVYYFSSEFGLHTLNWFLANFLSSIFLVVIILFRRDIRKALAEMGGRLGRKQVSISETVLNELVLAAMDMAHRRRGALIILEKNMALGDLVERGVEVDAKLSRDLLVTLFHPETPLHDGAIIVRRERIMAAACILPLAVGMKHHADLGTRHRAALGVTEETDAIAVVVSEERGSVSVAVGGKLTTSLDDVRLKRVLTRLWGKS